MTQPFVDPLEALRPLFEGSRALLQADKLRRGYLLSALLPKPPVGATPSELVHRQGKLELRYYAPTVHSDAAPAPKVPVIIIPSMINRAYIVDLEPDRSLVAGLAQKGHPVYLVDWGVPTEEDATHDVGTVLLDLLHRAVDRACRHAGHPSAFLLGYCQGGTLAAMYTALRPARVHGLAVFNAPVKFSEGGRFRQFVDAACFDVDASIAADRLVPTEIMTVGFKLLDPMGSALKYVAIDEVSAKPRELLRTLARERWLDENVPMPGAFAREFIRNAYQEDRLLAGTWVVRGETIDLRNIRCPLMVLAAKKDFIAPAPAVMPLATATSSADVHAEVLDTGHIGVVVGSYGPRTFYPLLDRWFRAHP
jgi:polyhydroxyalkanoate synthase